MRSIAVLIFFAGSLFAQDPSKPQISAFFDRVDDGPAFFVECSNTSGETLSSGAERWTKAIRIDGAVEPEPSLRMPPGLTMKGFVPLVGGAAALSWWYASSSPVSFIFAPRARR